MMRLILALLVVIYSVNIFAASGLDTRLISKYLDNMKSIAVDFVQTDSKGAKVKGTLLVSKPHRFRCNYYLPFPLLILGNENYLSIYDYDMETTTRIKAKENMFNFLLLDEKNITKYFVIKEIDDQNSWLMLTVKHIESGKRSIITFDKETDQISSIKIFETDNIITLTFEKLQQIAKFDNNLFILKNPDIFGSPERLNKKELQEKYKIRYD